MGTFEFNELFFIDKWVFLLFYNPTGFEYFSFRFKRVLKFIFDRMKYKHIFNLFLHTYRSVLKTPSLDINLKNFIRDYNIVSKTNMFKTNFIFQNSIESNNFFKFVNSYFIGYRFYFSAYYYLAGTFHEGIKTYDWRFENNYFIMFLSWISNCDYTGTLKHLDISKIDDFYYFNRHIEIFYSMRRRGAYGDDTADNNYLKKISKLKDSYTKLYKPFIEFELYSKAIQRLVVNKFNIHSYVNINTS